MKKFLLLFTAALVVAGAASAQSDRVAPPVSASAGNNVFVYVEQVARFKGNVNDYLGEQLNYPVAAQKRGATGKVYIRFVVRNDGSVSDVTVQGSSGEPDLDNEALRVIRGMNTPDGSKLWMPGMNNGVAVNSYFVLPIGFSLAK